MNKLLSIFLLSILVLYAQCDSCTDAIPAETNVDDSYCNGRTASSLSKQCVPNSGKTACEEKALPCSTSIPTSEKADTTKATKFCEGLSAAANKICQLNSNKDACIEVSKPTNSGSILNTFKITFTLIIIFAIL
jgi:hypothetical protein